MTMQESSKRLGQSIPIVSSAHLAKSAVPALSELEFGMIIAGHGFNRWIVRCLIAAGGPVVQALDVLVLHSVNNRGRAKSLAELCLILNIEDTHTVSYSLKKLERDGLVRSGKRGKEKVASITRKGENLCERYREIREELLVKTVSALAISEDDIAHVAALLRGLSGTYDQAARAAAAM